MSAIVIEFERLKKDNQELNKEIEIAIGFLSDRACVDNPGSNCVRDGGQGKCQEHWREHLIQAAKEALANE